MSQTFSRLEAQLQRLIEEGTARLLSSQDTKALLAAQLIEAMQAEVTFGQGDQLLAPTTYTIHTNSEHAAAFKSNQTLMDDLRGALKHAAAESGIKFPSKPVLHIVPEEGLAPHEFRVRCAGVGETLASTQSLHKAAEVVEHQIPTGAFLIVAGAEIFPLNLAIVNIGRKSDNHLVIEHPQVSRRHAQLRAISGHYHFFDLGSIGGSKINGADVKSAPLLAGDVISLADVVPLIYGQDPEENAAETQEFHPGENGKEPRV